MIIVQKHQKFYGSYRDEPIAAIINSESFKSKITITEKSPTDGKEKNIEKVAPLK